MGNRAVLGIDEEKDVCAYEEQYLGASQQSTANLYGRVNLYC
jgi:hypothetical protein